MLPGPHVSSYPSTAQAENRAWRFSRGFTSVSCTNTWVKVLSSMLWYAEIIARQSTPEWQSYYMVAWFFSLCLYERGSECLSHSPSIPVYLASTAWKSPRRSPVVLCTTNVAWRNHADTEISWQQWLLSLLYGYFLTALHIPTGFCLKIIWWRHSMDRYPN